MKKKPPPARARGDRLAYWNRFARPAVTPLYGYQLNSWWEDRDKAARLPRHR
ncbi:MAG: hypothetical protein QF511_13515 [Rhodospirillales bacterium]|nr:hypothetical protein [Rhodospirillales bacterium]MDP7216258.1 hypothetical protein [Rhodospirillales bacterium]